MSAFFLLKNLLQVEDSRSVNRADCGSLRTSKAGVTPLMGAARGGHRKAVEIFLQAGADPGARIGKLWEASGKHMASYGLAVIT